MRPFSTIFMLFTVMSLVQAASPLVLDDFETLTGWTAQAKDATFAAATSAAVGEGAMTVTLPGTLSKKIQCSDDVLTLWDGSQGLSFYVKGDGSDVWAPIAVSAGYGAFSYVYFFPLKSTDWVKYTVAWRDFIPEDEVEPMGTPEGLPPGGIQVLRFGCRWRIWYDNANLPAHSFSVDQVQIETHVPLTTAPPAPAPFAAFLEKLRRREPVTIQFQGDSITAGTALADKVAERYSTKTQDLLRQWLGYDGIDCRNRAVGGARVNDARAWLERDFVGGAPDLVTIWYGYNDKTAGYSKEHYQQMMSDYIDRIAAVTQGKSAIVLFATGPGTQGRFTMMDGYAQAIRDLAAARQLPCFDVHAMMKALGRGPMRDIMADQAHPNTQGHQLIADHLAQFLVSQAGIDAPRPQAPTEAQRAKDALFWDFESAPAGWLLEKQASISAELAKDGQHSLKLTALAQNPDHIRAWSEVITVEPGRRYHLSAMVFNRLVYGAFGLYVSMQEETGGTSISLEPQAIFRNSSASRDWSRQDGEFTVPKNVTKLRLLFWIDKNSEGDLFFDSPYIEPR